jgi:hypothetical protein
MHEKNLPSIYSAFSGINPNCVLIVSNALYNQAFTNSYYTDSFKTIIPGTSALVQDNTRNEYHLDFNSEPQNFTITGFNLAEDFEVVITNSNPDVVTINYIKENINEFQDNINFTMSQNGIIGESEITITITSNEYVYIKTINMDVVEEIPTSWSVEAVEGAQYGFELNDTGYYESKNKGKQDSYALCRLNIVNPGGLNVYLDCINYGESGCDFGLISKPNTPLALSNSTDSSSMLLHSFSNNSTSSVQTIDCGAIEGDIYIKYKKDYSVDNGNDSLQFTVRIE